MNPIDTIDLRPAESEDAGAIRRLIRQGGINPFGLQWDRFIVAVNDEGEVVGCGQLKSHDEEFVELASLVVTEELRGQGIGRALIEALMGRAARPLWLMCRSSLVPLYQKFGFEEVDPEQDQPDYFERMRRLVGIFNTITRRDEYLAVMVHR